MYEHVFAMHKQDFGSAITVRPMDFHVQGLPPRDSNCEAYDTRLASSKFSMVQEQITLETHELLLHMYGVSRRQVAPTYLQ